MTQGKILISVNAAWNLHNFRAGLIRALVDDGYEVVAAAPRDDYAPRLAALGCRFVDLPMDSRGVNPLRDALLLWRFYRLLRRERPAAFLGYTVKPNVYGSLAAHFLKIPVINNIAGLGTAFVRRTWLTRLVRGLYRSALSRSSTVFFQNEEDRTLFLEDGLARRETARRLPGSGVDLQRFAYAPARGGDGTFRFLLVARLLWDKGVGEYIEAARRVRRRHPEARFLLLGSTAEEHPAGVPLERLREWVAEGDVVYLGSCDDVRPHLFEADCVVLPSYREGAPRALLEAAAVGRPLVATDVAGCRDAVDDGVTGYLCRPRDAADLAEKLERILALPVEARREMGRRGREKMELGFDEAAVIGAYRDALRRALGGAA